ncbi:MAG: right-handed parallel beta-helix repeat-containing protein [Candidatus Paceibacterota bacterium]|jgi:parallel beta-helix repeat protein
MKKSLTIIGGIALVAVLGIIMRSLLISQNNETAQVSSSLTDYQTLLTKYNTLVSDTQKLGVGVVIDNSDSISVSRVGTWTKTTATAGFNGGNYESFKGTTGSFTFTPKITKAGQYEIFIRWTAGSNRAAAVPVDIMPSGMQKVTRTIDERGNNGLWVSLGMYNLTVGTGNRVVVRTTGTSGYVVADAVRFDLQPGIVSGTTTTTPTSTSSAPISTTPTPVYANVIVDNKSSGVVTGGVWRSSSYVAGFSGTDYLYGAVADGSVSVSFTPTLPVAGTYKVYALWTAAWAERDNHVPFEVKHKLGKTVTYIDQTKSGSAGKLLGTFSFDKGTTGSVTVRTDGTSGDVIADAVRFEQVAGGTALTPVTPITTTAPTSAPAPTQTPVPTPAPITGTVGPVMDNSALPASAIVVKPGQSIQTAIDNAVSGATIAIRAGTYSGNLVIQKTLTLRNYPGERPVISALDSTHAAVWFQEDDNVSAKNSRVSGLEIKGGYYGIKIDGGEYNPGLNNGIILENNIIHESGYDGVKVTFNADNIVIRNNEIYRTGRSGTNAQGIDSVGNDNIIIRGNYVHDTVSDGIFTKGGSVNGIIENNRVVNAGTGGEGNGIDAGMSATDAYVFDMKTNPGMYECINCIIRNNTITNSRNSGITVNGSKGTIVQNNTVSGFGTAGVRIAAVENWPEAGGYLQIPNSNVTLTGNKIKGANGFSVLIINTSLGDGLIGSFNGSNNTYYNTAGAVSLRDDTKSFTGGLAAWKQIRTDADSKEVAF